MANQYIFGEKAASDIADTVRRFKRLPGGGVAIGERRSATEFGQIEFGTLAGSMTRSGTATLNVYAPGTAGGTGTNTGITLPIVDFGMIPTSASPLASGKKVMVTLCRGVWTLSGYEC